ncbi:TonB-dependent receptor [Halosquirtibacter laminarini]|uniref:TonB-dependent receptor n=1 Tax=Halosquirtibacter laminarini TaxID=3374600 RepID=A0AC61NJF5_9BACT|nr:TonB-dependent receptor [Prolixibacteraceae bacterium]
MRTGWVMDSRTITAISTATILIGDDHLLTISDPKGKFNFNADLNQKRRLIIRSLGYKTIDTIIVVHRNNYKFFLKPLSYHLKEVQVNGVEKDNGSETTIGSMAIEHIQPSSFSDILQLLPGGIAQKENLSSANFISLREASYNSNSSLGTDFIINGSSITNDASFLGEGNTLLKSAYNNSGIDMRNISTDEIESVSVVKGVASVENGDITEGAVIIKEKRGLSPLTIRLKTNTNSKLVAIGKGLRLSDHWTWNISGNYLHNLTDPRSDAKAYTRLNQKNKWNYIHQIGNKLHRFYLDLDYTQSINNIKQDIEAFDGKDYYEKNQYQNISLNISDSYNNPDGWIQEFRWSYSLNYTKNKIQKKNMIVNATGAVTTDWANGESEGVYLPSRFDSYYLMDDQPLTMRANIVLKRHVSIGAQRHKVSIGASWVKMQNRGKGEQYDLTHPPFTSINTQTVVRYPVDLSEITGKQYIATYLNDQFDCNLFGLPFKNDIGIRATHMLGLNSSYDLSNRWILEPRWNSTLTLWSGLVKKQPFKFQIKGAWGIMSKMPTMSQLNPAPNYYQYQTLDFYSTNPKARRTMFWTEEIDTNNYHLHESTNQKVELGVHLRMGQKSFSLTTFYEKNNDSFSSYSDPRNRTETIYLPESIKDTENMTSAPPIEQFETKEISSNYVVTQRNNLGEKIKQGVEWDLQLGKISWLHSSIVWNGAWFKTKYIDHNPTLATWVDQSDPHSSFIYYGFIEDANNTTIEQCNSNIYINTHIPSLGMILSTNIGTAIYSSRQDTEYSGIPSSYIDPRGNRHPFTDSDKTEPNVKELVKHFNDYSFVKRKTPWASHINLKLTKEIGQNMKCSFYANNIINIEPNYKSYNGTVITRDSTPYFGAEISYKF